MSCKNAWAIIDTIYINTCIYKFSFILFKKCKGLRIDHYLLFIAESIETYILAIT